MFFFPVLLLSADYQTVIGRVDVGRELSRKFFVFGKEVGDVCDIGFAGTDALEELKALLEGRVGTVLSYLHAAQGDVFHTLEFFVIFFVNMLYVSEIGNVPEAVAKDAEFVSAKMPALDGDDCSHGIGG